MTTTTYIPAKEVLEMMDFEIQILEDLWNPKHKEINNIIISKLKELKEKILKLNQ